MSSVVWEREPEGDDSEVLLGLVDRVLALASSGLEGESGPELGRRLALAEQIQRRVEAFTVGVVSEAQRSGAWTHDGHRSPAAWVEATTNAPRSTATAQVRIAELAVTAPGVVDELRAGRVGVAQARELGRLHANPRVRDHLDADTLHQFLDQAAAQPYRMFRHLTTEWEALTDADGTHKDHDEAHKARRVSIGTVWNETLLSGQFGAITGAFITEVLERFTQAEFLADWEEAKLRVGDDVCKADLARTDAQRRADALLEIFRRAGGADPHGADVEPVVNLVMSWELFQQQLAAMLTDEPARFDVASMRWRLCLSTTGVPVDPADAVAAALLGTVRRVVLGADGTIINFGQRVRLFRGAARQAALIQALLDTRRRCLWPGCWQTRIQIDHADEHQHGGPTDLANASPLCGHHNRLKSRGYRTWRDPNGRWHVYRPDGTEIGWDHTDPHHHRHDAAA